jgi:hypothetical protein
MAGGNGTTATDIAGLSVEISADVTPLLRETQKADAGITKFATSTSKQAENVAKAIESIERRANPSLAAAQRAWGQLERAIPGTTRNLQIFEAVQKQADAALKVNRVTVEQHAAALERARARFVGIVPGVDAATKGTARLGSVMQQAGYQIADFATQASMGGNVMQALGVQGGQLISMFGGPWGAALGAAVTVGGILAGTLWNAGDATEQASKATDLYAQALRAANDLTSTGAEKSRRLRDERNEQAAAAFRAAISERELADAMAMTNAIAAQAAADETKRQQAAYLAQGPGRFLSPTETARAAADQSALTAAMTQAAETRRALNAAEAAYDQFNRKLTSTGGFSGDELDTLRGRVDGIVGSYDDATARGLRLAEVQRDLDDAVAAGLKTQTEADKILTAYTKHLDDNSEATRTATKHARDHGKAVEDLKKQILGGVEAADAEALRDWNRVMAEGQRVYEAMRTPAERYADEVGKLNGLLEAGAISQDTFTRAMERANPAMQAAAASCDRYPDDHSNTAEVSAIFEEAFA